MNERNLYLFWNIFRNIFVAGQKLYLFFYFYLIFLLLHYRLRELLCTKKKTEIVVFNCKALH